MPDEGSRAHYGTNVIDVAGVDHVGIPSIVIKTAMFTFL
jgi:hypothetical protein